MNNSATSLTTKRFLLLIVFVTFAVLLSAFVLSSTFRNSTPNDWIGRYQMRVTDSGTIIIMDTTVGAVTNVSKIEDYGVGERAVGGKAPPRPNPTIPAR